MPPYNNYAWNPTGSVHTPRVHGEAGATQYTLPPNSDMLLLDDSNPILYLKSTDAAGFATISKWALQEIKDPEPADFNAITNRMSKMESKMEEILRRLDNGKSNFRKAGSAEPVANSNAGKHAATNEAQ